MPFTKFVEVGRVAYVAFGEDEGKLCVIVNVIDQTRALVDGPCSGVRRKAINFKQLHLTPYKIKLSPGARSRVVRKYWEKEDVIKKWNESTWAKKIAAREKRATMTDFDRFKLMKAKQSRNRLIRIEVGRLRNTRKKEISEIRRKEKTTRMEEIAKKKAEKAAEKKEQKEKVAKKDSKPAKKGAPAGKKDSKAEKKDKKGKK